MTKLTGLTGMALAAWLVTTAGGVGAQTGPVPSAAAQRDLPEVLYIVPWKDSEPAPPLEPPRMSSDGAKLEPLDRDTFRRELHYRTGAVSAQETARPGIRTP